MNAPLILPEHLRAARAEAAAGRRRVVEVLEEASGLEPAAFVAALGRSLRYPVLDMARLRELAPGFDLIPYPEALARECLPLRDAAGQVVLVAGDPFAPDLQAWAETRLDRPFSWALAQRGDVAAYLAQYEESARAMDNLLPASPEAGEAHGNHGHANDAHELSYRAISEDASPVVRLVDSTLYDALKLEASDVHLESGPRGLAIKYRIDGVLAQVGGLEGREQAEQVISRIKVLSQLDIAERRIPQDGRFKVTAQGREVDFRVSIMPSVHGEDAVVRLLDQRRLTDQVQGLRLDCLGFDAATIALLRQMANEPYGMMLVTGPTGSGKTTTLYAAISEINTGQDKIVTIEDPVEYQLPGVLQIPVNEKKGLTFARGLRSILRHDPDKIMVGEIRDPETAQIAVQSALTGHLVFTTVHANNVFDVLGRFLHMGLDPYSFVSALNGILAQRLVRVTCPHCAVEEQPDPALLRLSRIAPDQAAGYRFRRGHGCGQCRGSGYKGRRAIAELLYLNDELREMITAREPIRRLKEAARRDGTRFLRDAALDLVRQGETTLQEINRVTFVA